MQTWVDLKIADGAYRFQFGLAQIKELETKCDAGLGRIYARTLAGRFGPAADQVLPLEGDYRFTELIEIIRQGLIGGNHAEIDGEVRTVSSVRANDIIMNYLINPGPDRLNVAVVWSIAASALHALVEGYTPPGEVGAGDIPAA